MSKGSTILSDPIASTSQGSSESVQKNSKPTDLELVKNAWEHRVNIIFDFRVCLGTIGIRTT